MHLSEVVSFAAGQDLEGFVARCAGPLLLALDTPEALADAVRLATASAMPKQVQDERAFAQTRSLDHPGHPLDDPEVLFLAKSGRNEFPEITVGRATTNDLPIDDDAVSKLQAHFVKKGDEWWVFDMASTNGTFVDGERVTPSGSAVHVGACVSFGPIKFYFHTPGSFHTLVRRTPRA